ncbi:MAG: hypothetical protein RL291_365, partial [Pseudomonadota bacterium]
LVSSSSNTTKEVSAQHQRELAELHEALVQLGQNQKTLSDGLDQWRQDAAGDLGVIGNRLADIEKSATMPSGMMQQLQADIQGLQQVTLADYDKNRRGIRNWIFGTEDIFAGSWKDDTAQLRARLRERETAQKQRSDVEVRTIQPPKA